METYCCYEYQVIVRLELTKPNLLVPQGCPQTDDRQAYAEQRECLRYERRVAHFDNHVRQYIRGRVSSEETPSKRN